MSIDIRLPNITGTTETEQLRQIRSYLYQLAPQLNWALSNLESKGSSGVVVQQKTGTAAVADKDKERLDNFNELKHLIIKSADIVNAYYEEIDNLLKLSGEYVAQSEFGTFKETEFASLSASSNALELNFENLQSIAVVDSGDDEQSTLIRSVDAFIKMGKLEELSSGVVYGIEIGYGDGTNDDANKFARFTPSALVFYGQNGSELAKFGSNMMSVPNDASIGGNLFLGKYSLDTTNGIAFKWTGKRGG